MLNGCIAVNGREDKARSHISYSQIQTYLICPQKYYYNYILRVPVEMEPEALVFGKHFHFAVSEFYRHWQKTGTKISLESLQEAFSEGWKEEPADIKFKNGNTYDTLREQALSMLEIFHAARAPKEVVAVESTFDIPLVDIETGEVLSQTLKGSFDLVERDDEGDIVLVELKTSGRAYSPGQIEYSIQPSLYLYALWNLEFLEAGAEGKIRYDVIVKSKQPKLQTLYTSRTSKQVQKAINLVKEVSRAIDLGVFYRLQGWQCPDCQFRTICE